MKKRTLFMIIGGIIAVAAIVVSLVFVFSGNDSNGGDITQTPETNFSIEGTWRIVANVTKEVPEFVDDQFTIFTGTQVSMFKGASAEAYATSSYTLNDANQLSLTNLNRQYKLAVKSDNCIRLYDGTDMYMLLIRNSSDDRTVEPVTTETLAGKWNVAMKGDELNNGEVLEFTGNSLNYYKGGSSTPAATVDFTLGNSQLNASALGLNMYCYKVSDNVVIFVQDTGVVWELTK